MNEPKLRSCASRTLNGGGEWAAKILLILLGAGLLSLQVNAAEDVIWQTFTSTAASYPSPGQGSTLDKATGTATDWTTGAASVNRVRGDGYVQFKFGTAATRIAVSLSYANPDQGFSSMSYGLAADGLGNVYRIDSGAFGASPITTYLPTDIFSIERVGTVVNYYKNKATNPTPLISGVMSLGTLLVDTSFGAGAGKVTNCLIQSSAEEDVIWDEVYDCTTNYFNTQADIGSKITRNPAGVGLGGAASARRIPGDGYVKFHFASTTQVMAIGLSTSNPDQDYTSIGYGIATQGNGTYVVIESGVIVSAAYTFTTADVFTIRRIGATVSYQIDGVAATTRPCTTAPLVVDAYLNTPGCTVDRCRYSGVSKAEKVTWDTTGGLTASYMNQAATSRLAASTGIKSATGLKKIVHSGVLSFRIAPGAGDTATVGLSTASATGVPGAINLGIQTGPSSTIRAIEGGTLVGPAKTYAANTLLTIERRVNTVNGTASVIYSLGGQPFYSHTLTGAQTSLVSVPLVVDAVVTGTATVLSGFEYSGVPAELQWRDIRNTNPTYLQTGTNSVVGSRLNKVGTADAFDADAIGQVDLLADGFIEFKPEQTNKQMAIGLTTNNTDLTDSIPYSFKFNSAGQFQTVVAGVVNPTLVTYAANDVFRLQRDGQTITWLRNDVFVTSASTSSVDRLFVDTSFKNPGPSSAIKDTRIYLSDYVPGYDTNLNGIPDSWEIANFGSLSASAAGNDPGFVGDKDHDGLSEDDEYLLGTDPNDYYNGVPPGIFPISDNFQYYDPSASVNLVVEIRDSTSTSALLPDAPVTFSIVSGTGALLPPTSVTSSESTGRAQVTYQLPSTHGSTSVVRATASTRVNTSTYYDFTVYTHKLVGRWKLDEATGATAVDSSAFANPGTLQGFNVAVTRPPGLYTGGTVNASDYSLLCDGISQYISVPNDTRAAHSLDFSVPAFSAAAWIRIDSRTPPATGAVFPIFSKWSSTGGGFELSLRDSAAKGISFRIMANGVPISAQELIPASDQSSILYDGRPHLVVFTRDSSNMGRLYIDAVLVGSLGGMSGSLTSTAALLIGKNSASSPRFFAGTLDDLRLDVSTLRPDEITSLYGAYDSDFDGMSDAWEIAHFQNLSHSATEDADGDGVSNLDEFKRGSDPWFSDTDNDGLSNFDETQAGLHIDSAPVVDPTGSYVNLQIFTPLE